MANTRSWLSEGTLVRVDLVDDVEGYAGTELARVVGLDHLGRDEPNGWTRYRLRVTDGREMLAWPEWVHAVQEPPPGTGIDLSH